MSWKASETVGRVPTPTNYRCKGKKCNNAKLELLTSHKEKQADKGYDENIYWKCPICLNLWEEDEIKDK